MFEKVNPSHPDKIADRIAGRLVDIAYTRSEGGWLKSNPKIAVEVLIGHGTATVIIETSCVRQELNSADVIDTVRSLAPEIPTENIYTKIVPQDPHLADNQRGTLRCGDNGIFKGMPITDEQKTLTALAATLYANFPTDGKYIIGNAKEVAHNEKDLTVCQSCATWEQIHDCMEQWCTTDGQGRADHFRELPGNILFGQWDINPLGPWTGGPDTDSGATNRKLGSDMGDAVTGGGLHGKDLSKADVSVNIMCHLLAQVWQTEVVASCAIGDEYVEFRMKDPTLPTSDGLPEEPDVTYSFAEIVEKARMYIFTQHGSFEKFAEWGLIAPGGITE